MQGYDNSSYGDAFADVYDEWYGGISDVDATVTALAGLAALSFPFQLNSTLIFFITPSVFYRI